MSVKEQLHRLVDELPEAQAQRLLQDLKGLGGDDDTEPLSPAELAAVRKSLEQIQRGESISRDEYQRRRRS